MLISDEDPQVLYGYCGTYTPPVGSLLLFRTVFFLGLTPLSCGLSLVGYVPLLRKVSFVWANSSLLLTGGIRWLSDKCIRPKQLQNSVAGFYSVGLTAGYPGKAVVKCGVELWEG